MTPPSEKKMESLVAACIAGDERAWHDLIDLVAPTIFAICHKSRLSRDESFDIFGQVSLKLIKRIGSLKSPQKIMSFVATITRRRIYKYYQQVSSEGIRDDFALATLSGSVSANPEIGFEQKEQRRKLLQAMNLLTERERRILIHLFFDERQLSYDEIAQKMNIPVSSIGPTRAKALIKLKRIMGYKRFKI